MMLSNLWGFAPVLSLNWIGFVQVSTPVSVFPTTEIALAHGVLMPRVTGGHHYMGEERTPAEWHLFTCSFPTGEFHLIIFGVIYVCFYEQISTVQSSPWVMNVKLFPLQILTCFFFAIIFPFYKAFFMLTKDMWQKKKTGQTPYCWCLITYTTASNHQVRWLHKPLPGTLVNDVKCTAMEHHTLLHIF